MTKEHGFDLDSLEEKRKGLALQELILMSKHGTDGPLRLWLDFSSPYGYRNNGTT